MKKKILITGAGTGIGKATAIALAKRGHQVYATTETEKQSLDLKTELKDSAFELAIFKLNILNESDRLSIKTYDLDVLINNAGIGESGSLAEIDINRLRSNFEVNVFCTLALSQLVLGNMITKKRGTVLFISSLVAKMPMPFLAPYCMSKAALTSGVRALRKEIHSIEKNVHVSFIEPGAYHTGFNQRNISKKFSWMDANSLFYSQIEVLRTKEEKRFQLIESKSTDSIVRKIVKAAESQKPRLRYTAPWWQAAGTYLAGLSGK